ncbi:MAG: hypothetical protein ACK4GO_10875 [Gemmobacter sp.]
MPIPKNLVTLHFQEEQLRSKATTLCAHNIDMQIHLEMIECTMNIVDIFREHPTKDENLKTIQFLGIRIFNALGSSLKLALSGYLQNSALVMRDVLETIFLIDLFRSEPTLIETWRTADRKTIKENFTPVKVRIKLDSRDGFANKRREEHYRLFSELAGHPNMKSTDMLRPKQEGDIVSGPFIEATSLHAVISELGQLAALSCPHLIAFVPRDWLTASEAILYSEKVMKRWMQKFYPNT